jgi:hypothetical protein
MEILSYHPFSLSGFTDGQTLRLYLFRSKMFFFFWEKIINKIIFQKQNEFLENMFRHLVRTENN